MESGVLPSCGTVARHVAFKDKTAVLELVWEFPPQFVLVDSYAYT